MLMRSQLFLLACVFSLLCTVVVGNVSDTVNDGTSIELPQPNFSDGKGINANTLDNRLITIGLLDTALLLGKHGFNAFVVFGSIAQYMPQYNELKIGRGQGFSPLICWILLTANIVRIFYWFGEPFDLALFFQSVVMIGVQLALLHAMTGNRKPDQQSRKHIFDGKLAHFWAWDDFQSYFVYCLGLATMLSIACVFLLQNSSFVMILGYLGLLIEAMLALPQLIHNLTHDTKDLSSFLFWTWLGGDIAKTAGFLAVQAPLPFLFCGGFQIITDIAILLQIHCSKRKKFPKEKDSHADQS